MSVIGNLELGDCYGYTRIDINSKSVKNLVVHGYMDAAYNEIADSIEIRAPYILSLKIRGFLLLWNILLLDVSSLVKADLDYTYSWYQGTNEEEEMLKGLILDLHHVKELNIGKLCSEALSRLEATGFLFPSNLKVLNSPEVSDSSDLPDTDSDSVDIRDWKV